MRLVFVGPPGSGKGTQAALLRDRLGLRIIGTGDIFRKAVAEGGAVGKLVEPYLQSGRLVPDEVVNEVVADYFRRDDRPTRFVMDGYPRTLAQARAFDAVLRQNGLALTDVVRFAIDDEEVVRRLGGRRLTEGRADDGAETVRRRVALYHAGTDDLVEHYRRQGLLRDVDATGDVESVYRTIVGLTSKAG